MLMDRTKTLDSSAKTGRRRPCVRAFALAVLVAMNSFGCATTGVERGRVFATLDGRPNPPVLLV
jgi:hypothetical protein